MTPLRVAVSAIGAWSAGCDNWQALQDALSAISVDPQANVVVARRPVPLLLPPAERRRVPDGVAVALEVAREALLEAPRRGVDTASLASVFASAHGELAIVDYLCATLATDPTLLSPTRFHHSVHNAAAGYWSIATPSVGPSTALAAGDDSVALGLLEAATQVVAEARPVLLVVFDTAGTGLLATVAPNTALFGAALLLLPPDADRDVPHLVITVRPGASVAPLPRHAGFHGLARSSPAARALALLEALAAGGRAMPDATIDYPLDSRSTISVCVLRAPACHDAVEPESIG